MTETLLIFDWDDTLCPTTWLNDQGLLLEESKYLCEEQRACLQSLTEGAIRMLRTAQMHGKVVIVTNACQGWVEMSCSKFMPLLFPLLQDIDIISARSTYEQHGVLAPTGWKSRAFAHEVQVFCGERNPSSHRWNIISLGDSMYEQKALVWVTEGSANCQGKSLKFTESPGIEQLTQEHELVIGCLQEVVDYDGDLDLEVAAQ